MSSSYRYKESNKRNQQVGEVEGLSLAQTRAISHVNPYYQKIEWQLRSYDLINVAKDTINLPVDVDNEIG